MMIKTAIRLAILALTLLCTYALSAQIEIADGGNVGINNLFPQYELDVNGSINFTDSLFINGVPFSFDGGETYWVYDMTANKVVSTHSIEVVGDINFSGQLLKDGVPIELEPQSLWSGDSSNVSYNGKVGIGIGTPIADLHISKSGSQNRLLVDRTDGVFGGIITGTAGSGFVFDATGRSGFFTQPDSLKGTSQGISNVIRIENDGRVGIGNNNPVYKLDVEGDVNFTGDLLKNGVPYGGEASTWISTDTSVHYMSKVGIGMDSPESPLHIHGSSDENRPLMVTSDHATQNGFLLGNNQDKWQIIQDKTPLNQFRINHQNETSWSNFLTLKETGPDAGEVYWPEVTKMGIGTNAPKGILELKENNGSLIFQSAGNNNTFFSENGYWDGSTMKYLNNGYINAFQMYNGEFWFRSATSGTAGSNATLNTSLTIKNNGNVGIGTTAPTQKLEVNGNLNVTGEIMQNGVALDNGGLDVSELFDLDVNITYTSSVPTFISGTVYGHNTGLGCTMDLKVDGILVAREVKFAGHGIKGVGQISFIVPSGSTYQFSYPYNDNNNQCGNMSFIGKKVELR